jgi:hypothetical protein
MAGWLLISYAVPGEPSALRVATWRALKQLGAAPLGSSVYALPDAGVCRDAVERLSERIKAGGGSALTLLATALSAEDEAHLRERFAGLRAQEYAQVAKSARHFIDHVDREAESEDYRFAEVESLEEELEKVRRQLRLVKDRDYFETPAFEEAQAAIAAASQRLTRYVDTAYERGE